MAVITASKSDVGRARTHNEDYVWTDDRAGVYVVADGLGGHEAGDAASQLAATTVGQVIAARLGAGAEHLATRAIRALLRGAVEIANERVRTAAGQAGQGLRMGATIVVALVRPPAAYIAHAGDSRAYLARGPAISRLTADDSLVAGLVRAGELSEAEARSHPQRHVVTKIVGQASAVAPGFVEVALAAGDWLVLCSDGLWSMLDDQTILMELQRADGRPARAVETLVQAANAAGGQDNISVVAIQVLPVESKGG